VAGRVLGNRGTAEVGAAPELPNAPVPFDLVTILDILHFLDDEALAKSLDGLAGRLRPWGLLVIRSVVPPPDGDYSLTWLWEAAKLQAHGISAWYRPPEMIIESLTEAGFSVIHSQPSGGNPESSWVIARKGE
jgi:hypothetical protein